MPPARPVDDVLAVLRRVESGFIFRRPRLLAVVWDLIIDAFAAIFVLALLKGFFSGFATKVRLGSG